MRPCPGDGGRCLELVESGRCPAHALDRARAKEAKPHRWVYKDPRWWRCRRRALRRAGYRCQVVEHGMRCDVIDPTGRRLHGHHDYPGGVRALLDDGGDPFDDALVVIVCDSHHARIEQALRAQTAEARRRR